MLLFNSALLANFLSKIIPTRWYCLSGNFETFLIAVHFFNVQESFWCWTLDWSCWWLNVCEYSWRVFRIRSGTQKTWFFPCWSSRISNWFYGLLWRKKVSVLVAISLCGFLGHVKEKLLIFLSDWVGFLDFLFLFFLWIFCFSLIFLISLCLLIFFNLLTLLSPLSLDFL